MNIQDEHAFSTGEIEEPEAPEEGFEGRYDNEPMLQKWLRKAWELRQACIAQQHALGKLDFNASTNIMTCERCGLEMDLNELVSPELQVKRWVA